MSVAKVIEVTAESTESWEAAAQEAVQEASKTIENIKSLYVKEMLAVTEGDQIVKYRVNAKITFLVKGS
jgi:hypothetical protein